MVSSRNDETTPLLNRIIDEPPQRKHATKLVYSYIFGFALLLFILVNSIRDTLPTPLSDIEARELDDFPGIHCYNEYLSRFNKPHSANQKDNLQLKNWIVDLAYDFKKEAVANNIVMEIIDDDPTDLVSRRNKFSTDEYWLVESRNVIIRLTGKSNSTEEAFLVNAHYDSVSTSHGVTDNGMGTAVAIELLRHFVQNPPQHTVIFLFNNFEEGGLIGADAFVKHPWFSTVKLFVNLEGTGAGGRTILARSNIMSAVRGLASSSAHYLHGSPLVSDMLRGKLLKSDTDYTTFGKHNVPGLDFDFYYPRAFYHTQRDDLAHTTPEALQHMGQLALASVKSIDSSPTIVSEAGSPDSFVYYDILGRFMLVYSYSTYQILNIVSLIIVPLGFFTWFWFSTTAHIEEKKTILKRNLWLIGQGFLSALAALAFMVGFTAFFAWIMLLVHPAATYGNINTIVIYLVLSALLGLVASQWVLVRVSKTFSVTLINIEVGFYGLTCIWWVFVLIAVYTGSQKIAELYFVIFFFWASTLATALLVATVPKDRDENEEVSINGSKFWFVAYLIQVTLPFILAVELLLLTMDVMRHTTADGTPESSLYFLLAYPIILLVLQLLPWVHAGGNLQKTMFFTAAAFVIVFLINLLSSPFNNDISPNRIIFNQEYNASDAYSTVILLTGSASALQKTLKHVLPSTEYDTLTCDTYMTYQTRCTYQTELTPLYARNPSQEITINALPPICKNGVCHMNITTIAEHSLLCQVRFTNPEIEGFKAWINGHYVEPEQNSTIRSLVAYSKKEVDPVHWDLTFNDDQDAGVAQVGCVYDDWTEGELPAFTTLRNNLPLDSLLAIRGGVGLAKVYYAPSLSLNKRI